MRTIAVRGPACRSFILCSSLWMPFLPASVRHPVTNSCDSYQSDSHQSDSHHSERYQSDSHQSVRCRRYTLNIWHSVLLADREGIRSISGTPSFWLMWCQSSILRKCCGQIQHGKFEPMVQEDMLSANTGQWDHQNWRDMIFDSTAYLFATCHPLDMVGS